MKFLRTVLAFFWLLALVSVALTACKEKETAAPAPSAVGPTSTCTDGIRNGDEAGVDCGGACIPCVTSGCFPEHNTLKFAEPNTNLNTTFASFECETDPNNNNYSITGTNPNYRLLIRLTNGRPNSSRIYTITDVALPYANSTASVRIASGDHIYLASNGKVYVNVSSGSISASFCGLVFTSPNTPNQLIGTGKAVCL